MFAVVSSQSQNPGYQTPFERHPTAMPTLKTLGNTALAALGRLPYFRGKGLLALAVMRLCQAAQPLTLPLPHGGRMRVYNDGTGHYLIPYWIGKYERETVPVFMACVDQAAAGEVIVDVGANVGFYTLLAGGALRARPGRHIHAFEPNPAAFQLLQDNLRQNGFQNVTTFPQGVADRAGRLRFYMEKEHSTSGSLRPLDWRDLTESLETPVVTLDQHLAQHPALRAGLIKVDIEGAELPALRGARRVLAEHQPYVLYEEYAPTFAAFDYTAADLRAYLRGWGYALYALQRSGPQLQAPADDAASGPWQNVLAVPPGRALPIA